MFTKQMMENAREIYAALKNECWADNRGQNTLSPQDMWRACVSQAAHEYNHIECDLCGEEEKIEKATAQKCSECGLFFTTCEICFDNQVEAPLCRECSQDTMPQCEYCGEHVEPGVYDFESKLCRACDRELTGIWQYKRSPVPLSVFLEEAKLEACRCCGRKVKAIALKGKNNDNTNERNRHV